MTAPRTLGRDTGLVPAVGVFNDAMRLYDAGGLPKGASTGWYGLDELWTVGNGQWTVVTGAPGSGKSEFVDALAVNLCEAGDWDVCFYSPENWPVSTHLVKLVEKRVRKPFGRVPTERMTRDEFSDAAIWINEGLFWIDPKHKAPIDLLATALHHHQPGKRLLVALDPWNVLEHERGGMSETDYISYVLTEVTKFVRSRSRWCRRRLISICRPGRSRPITGSSTGTGRPSRCWRICGRGLASWDISPLG